MSETYTKWTSMIYVFNLIVGTGALTLPKAFSLAGWILGSVLIIFLAFISYVTVTFVVEAMSITNAINQWKRINRMKRVIQATDDEDETERAHTSEDTPLFRTGSLSNFPSFPVQLFTIDEKVEMSQMAKLLFTDVGKILVFLCFSVYLFGDLAIYSAAVSKSLVTVACGIDRNSSSPDNFTALCSETRFTQQQAYRAFLCAFLLVFGPFVFFNVQKTKYLQIITSLTRWLAFTSMITLAVRRLMSPNEKHGSPPIARLPGIPELFGSCIYSFMCHHSLPGLLSPIVNKSNLYGALAADYLLVLVFYLTLALTGVFAFPSVYDLYTLNFTPKPGDSFVLEAIDYALTLFPVFTLSTNFPVVAITLRSNLQAVFSQRSWVFRELIIPAFAVTAPVMVAIFVEDVEMLVGFTGYTGTGIQYVIPALLVISARAAIPADLLEVQNEYASPFSSRCWPAFVIAWSILFSIFVTVNFAKSAISN